MHRFLFKHGVYVLLLLLGGGGVYGLTILPQPLGMFIEQNTPRREHMAAPEDVTSLAEISGLVTHLLYGRLTHEKSTLSSVSNLVSYQGVVLPRIAEISTTKPLFDMTRFSNGQATSGDISRLVEQLINLPTNRSSLPSNPTLTLSQSIINEFNLQCLGDKKISNVVCNKFLTNFLTYGKFYNIDKYSQDLQSIQTSLRTREKEHNQFCTLVYEHTKWYRQTSNSLNTIMQQCPLEHMERYRNLRDFITVDQEVGKSLISNFLSTHPDINAYKLLSLQQILYKNLQAGNPNKNFIINYLEYSQQLINKIDALSPLYKDILYRVNNYELLPKLETSNHTTISKTEASQIIEQIILLNKGNPRLSNK